MILHDKSNDFSFFEKYHDNPIAIDRYTVSRLTIEH